MATASEYNGRKFDRVFRQQQRQTQARFQMSLVSTPEQALTKEQQRALDRGWRFWEEPPILDQGNDGACTGFGCAGYINAGPVRPGKRGMLGYAEAMAIYKRAREIDEWPGEDYEGSSVDAAVRALREQGRVKSFYWGRELATVQSELLVDGPVILGLDWTEAMCTPDAEGFIQAQGSVVGGHCVAAVGINTKKEFKIGSIHFRGYVKIAQSWGKGHGKEGFVYLPLEDLAKLIDGLESPGDACIAVEQKV